MIILSEQYGYGNPLGVEFAKEYENILTERNYKKSIQKGKQKSYCYYISHSGDEENLYRFETSYFVGVDWIVENELPIYVKPKLNKGNTEINYIQMLFDIMKEPANYDYLDELCEIDFHKPTIAIEQKQDLLTPLLLIQFLHVLKKIVQKGLKKSYYTTTKNLNAKVKGKILVNQTIKKNHFNNKKLFNYCTFNEFGINSIENKMLKKALLFSLNAVQNLRGIDTSKIKDLVNYIQPAFANVGVDVERNDIKKIKHNKLYKEYEVALKLANLILKRYGYNISSVNATKVKTPPFWVDMSKLFELYVFAKLKERFPNHGEVIYHRKINYLELDYLVKSNDGKCKMVVDAKYKPRYKEGRVSKEDIRQVSGYARLKGAYDFLEIDEDKNIDCLIIYSSQDAAREDFKDADFKVNCEEKYVKFYKIGIKLPTIKTDNSNGQ